MKLNKLYKKIRKFIILKWRNIGFFIKIDFSNKIPKLNIHEKYEKTIKWILRILIFVGILISIISLPWYISLIITIILISIEQVLENVVFMFNICFLQPLPKEFNTKDWLGMLFGFLPDDKNGRKFIVGMIFENENSGKELFDCISLWNYNNEEDKSNNIQISFILEKGNEYSTYIYPSANRPSIKEAEEKSKENGKVNNLIIFGMMLCKIFPYNQNSYFKKFKEYYKDGTKYEFGGYFMDKNKEYKCIEGTKKIIKWSIKIKNRSELTKFDQEYDHGRFSMNIKD